MNRFRKVSVRRGIYQECTLEARIHAEEGITCLQGGAYQFSPETEHLTPEKLTAVQRSLGFVSDRCPAFACSYLKDHFQTLLICFLLLLYFLLPYKSQYLIKFICKPFSWKSVISPCFFSRFCDSA